ncbi:hypothetical protein MYU51_019595 [Penicillium brevicompactum]
MSLLSLELELALLISSHLNSPKDLLSLLRTSQKFYHLLTNELYQNNLRSDGGSALLWYASRGDELGVRNMLRAGANVNVRSSNLAQSTALLGAVNNKHITKLLLEHGAMADAVVFDKHAPLLEAVRSNEE